MIRSNSLNPLWFIVALWCVLLFGVPAHACSCDYPDIGFLAKGSIEVPGNAKGLLWGGEVQLRTGLVEFPPAENFHVEVLRDQNWIPLPVELNLYRDIHGISDSPYDVLLVGPEGGLETGRHYRFVFFAREARALGSSRKSSALDSQVVHVVVSEEEFHGKIGRRNPGPLEVGKLWVAAGGPCSQQVDARWVDIDHILPPELRKWEDSLYYSVVRPDHYWHPRSSECEMLPPGRSWLGPGKARLYHLTGKISSGIEEKGLPADANFAWFYAKLPGTKELYRLAVYLPFGDKE